MICADMRVTVHLPDDLGEALAAAARSDRRSLSSLVAEAVAWYLLERRRRALGERVLQRAGRARLSPDALQALHDGRHDRRP